MRPLQKIYDTLRGGADGPPPLPPLDPDRNPQTPVRTRMGTPTDVAIMLDARAEQSGHGADWRGSLPALLALLGMEDTPAMRRRLAEELNLDLAAEPDERLHAALIQRLADNDALAPQDFYK